MKKTRFKVNTLSDKQKKTKKKTKFKVKTVEFLYLPDSLTSSYVENRDKLSIEAKQLPKEK